MSGKIIDLDKSLLVKGFKAPKPIAVMFAEKSLDL